ncbi:hypothetical protein GOBAR_DD23961 [Gossypium barbadense]|nr:hypothetical protein GOBAR_DD23959 [Gossypium barbadense]PPD79108.1 hypothetical protein GOBAR_DD23961 [Gossypium barbadense]
MKNQNQKKINGEMKMGKKDLSTRLWIETKKLWVIVGPSIISPVASYSMNIITQAFAGHLGDVQLVAISIANTAIVGFNFGLIAFTCKDLGSFYSFVVTHLRICYPGFKAIRTAGRRGGDVGGGGDLVDTFAL